MASRVRMTEPFTELRIEREDLGQLLLSFDGDSFELEDQRNWGDASFKTYCTPLRKGFPRAVRRGTLIAHRVKVRFTPADRRRHPSSRSDRDAEASRRRRQSLPNDRVRPRASSRA